MTSCCLSRFRHIGSTFERLRRNQAGTQLFRRVIPLFGYDLNDYNELFTEKLDLFLKLREFEIVTWSAGNPHPALFEQGIYPSPYQQKIPVLIEVGGVPESAIRARTLVLPLAIGIIGGMPEQFGTLVVLHRKLAVRAGDNPSQSNVSINYQRFI